MVRNRYIAKLLNTLNYFVNFKSVQVKLVKESSNDLFHEITVFHFSEISTHSIIMIPVNRRNKFSASVWMVIVRSTEPEISPISDDEENSEVPTCLN